ncbi:uncharacterized protein BO66DRAFT_142433 [Aspergillus aculeatinus CBS 121060]|uniref:Uncharacterized protein n=1 Tax=Aspergillus aculeatinus CBS 121060 TaxID=1448322 RepID=A0ACD1HKE6_9EURO|nr:hypothetical protein BO66DRAFT_142433 [Aspergillus aculeatinus CBS 121060]RAH74103.1 hypothetical protein BO66DRAFT_142433 [Aspergillus aculeatinus CBS 121060]
MDDRYDATIRTGTNPIMNVEAGPVRSDYKLATSLWFFCSCSAPPFFSLHFLRLTKSCLSRTPDLSPLLIIGIQLCTVSILAFRSYKPY